MDTSVHHDLHCVLGEHNRPKHDFLRSCHTGVHRLYPGELIAGFELLVYAFGLGELGSDELDLLHCLAIDLAQMVVEFKFHAKERIVRLAMLIEVAPSHSTEAADVLG